MCKSSLHRECLHCGTDISDKHGLAKFCSQSCRSTYNYQANRVDILKRQCDNQFQRSYGITREQRDLMFAEQDGDCKCCGRRMTLESHQPHSAHVDHCHTTGEVKSLLCAACNKAAGLLGESHEIALKLAAYLLDTGKVPTR